MPAAELANARALEILIPDPSLVLLIGPSGAGKSTFAAKHFEPSAIVSSDTVRREIAGGVNDQTRTHDVFSELHRRVEDLLCPTTDQGMRLPV
jgi:protein phosphatase